MTHQRREPSAREVNLATDDYRQGMTLLEIAKKYNAALFTMRDRMVKAGLVLRTHGESRTLAASRRREGKRPDGNTQRAENKAKAYPDYHYMGSSSRWLSQSFREQA